MIYKNHIIGDNQTLDSKKKTKENTIYLNTSLLTYPPNRPKLPYYLFSITLIDVPGAIDEALTVFRAFEER